MRRGNFLQIFSISQEQTKVAIPELIPAKRGKLFGCRATGKRKGNSGVAEQKNTEHEDGYITAPLPDIPLSPPPFQFP